MALSPTQQIRIQIIPIYLLKQYIFEENMYEGFRFRVSTIEIIRS